MTSFTTVRIIVQRAHGKSTVKRAKGVPLDLYMVVGVQVGDGPMVRFKPPKYDKYALTDFRPEYQTLKLPTAMARRLGQFVELCYVQGASGYDCFNFMDYLTGYLSTPIGQHAHRYGGLPVRPEQIALGQPYVIFSDGYQPIHGMIGVRPGYVLSVNGLNCPLAICGLNPLVRAYGGKFTCLIDKIYP